MLSFFSILSSSMLGLAFGSLHGFFFLAHKKRVLSLYQEHTERFTWKDRSIKIIFSLGRLTILAMIWFYLSKIPSIHFALLIPCFLLSFWYVILKMKFNK